MPQAAVDTFVSQHGNFLVGKVSTKWQAFTANHPELAASRVSMELAALFEAAIVSILYRQPS